MSKTILTILSIVLAATICYAESVKLQTYYPSPYGIYNRLRLVPLALSPTCAIGSLAVSTDNNLYYCGDPVPSASAGVTGWMMAYSASSPPATSGQWSLLGGGEGVWILNGSNIYPAKTSIDPSLQVGIGTTDPQENLHVYSPGATGIVIDGPIDPHLRINNGATVFASLGVDLGLIGQFSNVV